MYLINSWCVFESICKYNQILIFKNQHGLLCITVLDIIHVWTSLGIFHASSHVFIWTFVPFLD